jgi:uncharacterized protein (DUF1330 family)
MGPRRPCVAIDRTETQMNRSSYLVYICQAVKNRTGLERYWQVARYPENIDVLAGYGPFEVLDADQEERVEGVVLAEFPPFQQTVEWFNGDAYVQARKNREGNEYLGILVDSGVMPISKRKPGAQTDARMPAYECRRPSSNGCRTPESLPRQQPPPGVSIAQCDLDTFNVIRICYRPSAASPA